jgi:chromate transporter
MPEALVVFGMFTMISLMALGGGTAVIPELHAQVKAHGWLTDRQFVDLYAISNIAPGPTMLFICIIAWKAAGWPGMFLGTIGMFGPSSLLTYYVRGVWDKFETSPWRHAIEKGLAPTAVGLLFSGALVIARGSCDSPVTVGICVATALLTAYTRINLLIIMAVAGVVGFLTT